LATGGNLSWLVVPNCKTVFTKAAEHGVATPAAKSCRPSLHPNIDPCGNSAATANLAHTKPPLFMPLPADFTLTTAPDFTMKLKR
jgi:hypothetical protein